MKLIFSFLFFSLFLVSCQPGLIRPPIDSAPQIRVLLKRLQQPDSLILNGEYTLISEEAQYELGQNNKILHIVPLKKNFRLYTDNRSFTFNLYDNIRLHSSSPGASFSLRNKAYQGDLHLGFSEALGVSLINKIDLEKYLYAVVSSEMPSSKKEYFEALKAQAICARTYALAKIKKRKNHLYDVSADHNDQVYGGLHSISALARKAVDRTRGDVLTYNDSLATVFYHSTCGGISESAENIWPGLNPPYLQSRKDVLGNGFSCQSSPYYRWRRVFTMSQLDSLLQTQTGYSLLNKNVKDTTEILFRATVLQRSSSGRVQKMKLEYADSVLFIEKYKIRSFFHDSNGRGLPSLLFNLKSKNDSLLVFEGAGFGHGVGMCQWGALHMSEQGFKDYDILIHKYFPGTRFKKEY